MVVLSLLITYLLASATAQSVKHLGQVGGNGHRGGGGDVDKPVLEAQSFVSVDK